MNDVPVTRKKNDQDKEIGPEANAIDSLRVQEYAMSPGSYTNA